MNQTVFQAILNHQVIRIYYGGERTIEPHCLGVSTAGNEVIRAYQTEGYSASGNPSGWKMFYVARMSMIALTGTYFSAQTQYNPNDSAMVRIYAQV